MGQQQTPTGAARPVRDPFRDHTPLVRAYTVLVDGAAVVASVVALLTLAPSGRDLAVAALLLLLALGFEEGATRVARLQWRLSSELKRDMTSVWAVAAAVSLPAALGVLVMTGVFVHIWFRQRRPTAQPLWRTGFIFSSNVLGLVLAGTAVRSVEHGLASLPWALATSVAVLVAIAVHTTVNRGLVTGALLGVGARGKALLGTRDENLTEFATLCLGGLLAVVADHEPWLCVLVLAPLVALHRGAFVRELETAAMTDSKTGLFNAVAWEQVAQREIGRARRESVPVAVLIADLDHFKGVNDRYGHLNGDRVLAGVGRALQATVREYDSLGRFGGEEFVAVLPDADTDTALAVAERVRARVHALSIGEVVPDVDAEAGEELLSVSIGVAVLDLHGAELSDLLHAADQALYAAKHSGRNRVALAGDGPGRPALEGLPVA